MDVTPQVTSLDNASILGSILYLHWGQNVLQLPYDTHVVIMDGTSNTSYSALIDEIIAYNIARKPMALRRQQFHRFKDNFKKWLLEGGSPPFKPQHIPPDQQMIIDEWNAEVDDNVTGLEDYLKLDASIERPVYIPDDVWKYISHTQRPHVAERWGRYPEERRAVIIDDIDKIDICTDRPRQRPYIRAIVWANVDAYYHIDDEDPPTIPGVEMRIFTTTEQPIVSRRNQYFSPMEKAFLEVKCRVLERTNKIEESCSPYRAPLVLVQYPERVKAFMSKHPDNGLEAMKDRANEAEVATFYRMTVDMRLLNAATITDKHPMPRAIDVINSMQGMSYFSCGDIMDAFWGIKLAEIDRHKTAFATHDSH